MIGTSQSPITNHQIFNPSFSILESLSPQRFAPGRRGFDLSIKKCFNQ
ncbi:MAG: hypothetical protein AAB316_15750 [Bacteroidota bacterium]